jgi:hypothetical protein
LQAVKTYGLIVADNGRAWYLTGVPDPRWDDEITAQLKRVKGSDLEAVDALSLQAGPHSAAVLDPNPSNRVTVAFGKTLTFDLSAAGTQSVTLTGNVTASTLTNMQDGQTVSFLICQDSVGGRSFKWPANVVGGMQIGVAPGKCSAQSFVSDGSKLYATTPGVPNM